MNRKDLMFCVLLGQCALIGLFGYLMVKDPSPEKIGISVAGIAVNIAFGIVNIINMTKKFELPLSIAKVNIRRKARGK